MEREGNQVFIKPENRIGLELLPFSLALKMFVFIWNNGY